MSSSPLSWMNMGAVLWDLINCNRHHPEFLIPSYMLVYPGHDRENTANSNPTKGCPIWSTIESLYNRKIKSINFQVSGKGIIWRSLLTRDVSISIKSMTTKALLFTVHYKVYSNYVFKSVYTLYKKLNRDGVEVMDIWWRIYGNGYMVMIPYIWTQLDPMRFKWTQLECDFSSYSRTCQKNRLQ